MLLDKTPPTTRLIPWATALGWLLLAAPVSAEHSQTDQAQQVPTVSVLTFGPGTSAFTAFGHNAFRIQDPRNQTDLTYNFGTFRFNNPLLLVDFLKSRFKYWLGVKPFERMMRIYKRRNRFVHEQVLNLTPRHALQLTDALVENAKPENRVYLYNYYRDNCSTRIRDAIDRIFQGQLKEQFSVPGKMTLREHSLRASADVWEAYIGIDILLGDYIDQPETFWDEMFLPEILEAGLGKARVKDALGSDRPLVSKTRVLFEGKGGPRMAKQPPHRTFEYFLAGFGFGALVLGLAFEAFRRKKRWARAAYALTYALFGLLIGLIGNIFLGLWLFTDHDPAYRNENLLQCAPWAVIFIVGAWGILRSKPRLERFAYWAAASTFAASALGFVAKVLPFADQDNQRFIAFFLPAWAAFFFGVVLMKQMRSGDDEPVEPAPALAKSKPPRTKQPAKKSKKRRR